MAPRIRHLSDMSAAGTKGAYAGNSLAPSQFPPAPTPGVLEAERKHFNLSPTSTTAHLGAPKPLDCHPKGRGPLPERFENGKPWNPPHAVYDSRTYAGGLEGGRVYPQTVNSGTQGRYIPNSAEYSDDHPERHLQYKGNQAPGSAGLGGAYERMPVWNSGMIPDPDGEKVVDPVLDKIGEEWLVGGKSVPHPTLSATASSPAATGSSRHSDQREVAGYTSTQDWSQYKGPQLSEAEARRAASRGVGARQIVGEVMTEFGQTTTGAMSGGVLDYYARGGKGTKTPFYDQNVYSAPGSYAQSPAPPCPIQGRQAPGWMAELRPDWAQKQAEALPADKLGSALAKVKEAFRSRGAVTAGRSMWRIVRQFDHDNSGAIDIFDMQKGMQPFGISLDKPELLSVMNAFDRGDRRIDLEEFMFAIRGNLNELRQRVVEIAFQEIDGGNSGVISMGEINACYDTRMHPEVVGGKITRDEAHHDFVAAMEKDLNGNITRSEFLDFFKDISLAFESDDGFTKFVRCMWRKRR